MKRWQSHLVAALVGLALGALGWHFVESWATSDRLARQAAELVSLKAELGATEGKLLASETRLASEALALKTRLERAVTLVDQVTVIQGSSSERLKKVIEVLRNLRSELSAR